MTAPILATTKTRLDGRPLTLCQTHARSMQEKRHGVEGKDGMYSRAKRMVVSSGFMIPLPPSTQGDKLAGRA
jgi:hypothetical protein